MKKSLALIAVCLAVVLLLAGCAGKQAEKGSVPGQTKDTAEPTKIEEGEAEETEDKAADAEAADTPEAVEAGEAEETKGKAADAEAADNAEAGEVGNTAADAETADAGTSEAAALPEETGSGSPVVYFSSDISAEGLVNIYDALGWTPAGKTAVKISTGEPGKQPSRSRPGSRPQATICGRSLSKIWSKKWTGLSSNVIRLMGVPGPVLPCTGRWRRITDLRRSRILT